MVHAMRRKVASIAVLVVLIAFCVRSIRKAEDYGGFVLVGEAVLAGEHIYADTPPGINTWPPVWSLVCVPLAVLDQVHVFLGRGVWLLLGLIALLVCLGLLVRLLHRRRLALPLLRDGVPLSDPVVLVPLALCYVPVIGNFIHLQVNTIVLALVLGGLVLQARGRPYAGGAVLGLAVGLRIMPVVVVPYLLWRRRWVPAISAIATAVVVFMLPAMVYGWERFADYVSAWREVAGGVGTWGVGHMNQSMPAMWDRYVGLGVVPFVTEPSHAVASSGQVLPQVLTLATMAAAALAALWRFRGTQPADGPRAVVEWSIVLLVGASFGPVSWKAYLVVLLVPYALLFALRRRTDLSAGVRGWCTLLLVIGLVFTTLPTRDLLGRTLTRHLETGSVFAIGVLLLIAGLFVLHARLPASTPAVPDREPSPKRSDHA